MKKKIPLRWPFQNRNILTIAVLLFDDGHWHGLTITSREIAIFTEMLGLVSQFALFTNNWLKQKKEFE